MFIAQQKHIFVAVGNQGRSGTKASRELGCLTQSLLACRWSSPSPYQRIQHHFLFRRVALVTTWTPQSDSFVASTPRLSFTFFDVSGSWASGSSLWNSLNRLVKDVITLRFLRISSSSTPPLSVTSAYRSPFRFLLPNAKIGYRTLLIYI